MGTSFRIVVEDKPSELLNQKILYVTSDDRRLASSPGHSQLFKRVWEIKLTSDIAPRQAASPLGLPSPTHFMHVISDLFVGDYT